MQINRALIEKYNKPVPRYTSYPPANFFRNDFTEKDYRTAIIESNEQDPQNISFYVHIPFCHKLCFYCGCNSTPMAQDNKIKQYILALKAELAIVLPLIDKNRKISQIHYGGGTPNAIAAEYLKELNEIFLDSFKCIDNPEIAIECHPAYLDEAYINKLKEAGFNRFSLGIQDFKSDVLKNINRNPSNLPIDKVIELIKYQSDNTVNLDFIYGLPGQTVDSFKSTLEKAISLEPNRLVTFSYAHVPWVNKAQMILEKQGLPNSNDKLSMYEMAYNLLTNNGYASIGLDHFVKPEDELFKSLTAGKLHRNFQGYCTRQTTGQVYAFGVSGISQLNNVYAQNSKLTDEYISNISKGNLPIVKGYKLNADEVATRSVITQLMCNKRIDIASIGNFDTNKLQPLIDDDIVEVTDSTITVKEHGMLFIRNVAALFDPLIDESKKSFSKSI